MSMQCFMAPAKINLCLHVLGRRSSGYHDLCMLMQKVNLYDEVWIGLRDDPGVRVECAGVSLQGGEENIALRAAEALLSYVHDAASPGVDIRIVKHIPVAAGLGGGSSDAATVLMALNHLLALNVEQSDLARLALKLGADVPFFLGSSPAWAEGVGEMLTPLSHSLPKCYYVLANSGAAVSTAQVYRNVQLYSCCPCRDKSINTLEELISVLHNDLESPALLLAPEIEQIKSSLLESGAKGTLMSGSGATVFGLFEGDREAHTAAQHLEQSFGWWAKVVTEVA